MATFAKDTTVSVDASVKEIRNTLKRYNATKFAVVEDEQYVVIAFDMRNRRIRFTLPLPCKDDPVFRYTNGGPHGKIGDWNENGFNQAIRQKWRALNLCIKAKLESVEAGIETLEDAFMGQLVLADGRTMSEWAKPQIERLYGDGQTMPPMLGSGSN